MSERGGYPHHFLDMGPGIPWYTVGRQVGGTHPTGMLSCLVFHVAFSLRMQRWNKYVQYGKTDWEW